jgi:hypothetical protein
MKCYTIAKVVGRRCLKWWCGIKGLPGVRRAGGHCVPRGLCGSHEDHTLGQRGRGLRRPSLQALQRRRYGQERQARPCGQGRLGQVPGVRGGSPVQRQVAEGGLSHPQARRHHLGHRHAPHHLQPRFRLADDAIHDHKCRSLGETRPTSQRSPPPSRTPTRPSCGRERDTALAIPSITI